MNLFIYGAGSTGQEILDIVNNIQQEKKRWDAVFFVDDVTQEQKVRDTLVFKFQEMLQSKKSYECIIAIGEPAYREYLYNKIKQHDVALATIIDPRSNISNSARIGAGCIVGPSTFISCNTVLKENIFVEINCIIGHNIFIDNHSVISSCSVIGGGSHIGKSTFIGMNSSIKEKIKIGSNTIIGMASAVFQDVGDGLISTGNPSRVSRKNENRKVFK